MTPEFHDPIAERAVLSCLISVPEAVAALAGDLSPELFSEERLIIFEAICAVSARRLPVDLITVTQQLRDSGQLTKAGGVALVTSLQGECTSIAVAIHCKEALWTCYEKREANRIGKDLLEGRVSTQEAIATLLELEKKVPCGKNGQLPAIISGSEVSRRHIELPQELICGMLHRGSKMVLGGGSKSFKTWCLCDLAISIATGRRWWGREVKQGNVVYLNLEVQNAFFEQRLQLISRAKGCSLPDALGVWNLRGYCADHRVLLPELTARLFERELAAVVLDPTYKVMSGSENAQEEVAALMDSIEKLALRTGAAVIFGSHFAKGNAAAKDAIDRISGSGVFARDPDAILTMTRHEEEDVFVVDPILRNCPPIPPFCVKWDFPLMKSVDRDTKSLRLVGAKRHSVYDAAAVLNGEWTPRTLWVAAALEKGIGKSRMYELIKIVDLDPAAYGILKSGDNYKR